MHLFKSKNQKLITKNLFFPLTFIPTPFSLLLITYHSLLITVFVTRNSQLVPCTSQPETRNSQSETCNLPPILSSSSTKNYKPKTKDLPFPSLISPPPPCTSQLKTENQQLKTVLQISLLRPDRIIFEGKEVKVTTIGFSLICLLARHRGQVMIYEDITKKLWGKKTDAIYTRIIQHICKIRKDILDVIGNNKTNKEKVKDIFKVVSGRGVMLNINDTQLIIN